MKNIKNFESWKNNIIDQTLFTSGKAKYNPQVLGGAIKYKTGNIEPYYHAKIEKLGNRFICKIYKRDEDGNEIRLRNKLKKDLKTAHNYVREFLNQKLKRDIEKSKKDDVQKRDKIYKSDVEINKDDIFEPTQQINKEQINKQQVFRKQPIFKPKSKPIIRRF